MRWAVHIAFMEEETFVHRTLHVNREKKYRGEIKNNFKIYPKEIGRKVVAYILRNQDRNNGRFF